MPARFCGFCSPYKKREAAFSVHYTRARIDAKMRDIEESEDAYKKGALLGLYPRDTPYLNILF